MNIQSSRIPINNLNSKSATQKDTQLRKNSVKFILVPTRHLSVLFIDIILPAALRSWVETASNRNEYQRYILGGKGGRCVGLITLPTSCDVCLEILGILTTGSPKGLSKPVMG